MENIDNKENKTPNENNEEENVVNLDGMNGEPNLEINTEDMLSSLQQDLQEARERTMRALAESENTRKRAQKEREDAGKYAVASFARDLLDFSDNFGRAIESMPDSTPVAVTEGLQAMETELLNTFERHGIRKVEPLGEPFDANFHEVMFEAPTPDKAPGTIIQIIEAGYVLNDRLLRAAKVGLAKTAPTATQNTDPGAQIDIEG